MKRIVWIAIVLTLTGVMGCAQQDRTPAQAPEAATEQQPTVEPISTEDFESGEAQGAVQSGEEAEAEQPGDPDE